MSDKSQIQWTDATWNPTTGCTKVSPGCAHCYIERTPAFRIHGRKFVNGATDLQLHEDRLKQPLHWKKPRRVFVNSLSDLFHDDVRDAFIDQVFAVMALAPQHTFQVLTKRPERMRDYISDPYRRMEVVRHIHARLGDAAARAFVESWRWPLPNVQLGVSVENQHFADERIPLLLRTPAAVRFISAEPLLAPVTFRWAKWQPLSREPGGNPRGTNHLDGLRRLDWVIVGGESGPKSRPFRVQWARAILKECKEAGVPCFIKQLGSNLIDDDIPGPRVDPLTGARTLTVRQTITIRDHKGGDPGEWPEDLRVREFPA